MGDHRGQKNASRGFTWYQSLPGRPGIASAHAYWGQICESDGTVLTCVDEWGSHGDPSLASPDAAPTRNGLLLFLRVADFDLMLHRARALASRPDEEPHVSPHGHQRVCASGSGRLLRHCQCPQVGPPLRFPCKRGTRQRTFRLGRAESPATFSRSAGVGYKSVPA